MILGLSIPAFITFHVCLSLIGIASGLVVVAGMIHGRLRSTTTAVFLATTVLTSVTGFPIPPYTFTPARAFGIASLVLLALALLGLYVFRLAGHWRWVYIVSAVTALYLNSFVGVVQTFQKVPFFNVLAPTQAEPPFAVAQLALIAIFIGAGTLAVRRFYPHAARPALSAR